MMISLLSSYVVSYLERFVIIVNGWKPLAIITKPSILDVAAVLDPLLGRLFFTQETPIEVCFRFTCAVSYRLETITFSSALFLVDSSHCF